MKVQWNMTDGGQFYHSDVTLNRTWRNVTKAIGNDQMLWRSVFHVVNCISLLNNIRKNLVFLRIHFFVSSVYFERFVHVRWWKRLDTSLLCSNRRQQMQICIILMCLYNHTYFCFEALLRSGFDVVFVKLQAYIPCQGLCLRVTGAGAEPLKILHFKALSGIAIVLGRRVACRQSHDLIIPSLDIIK